jgi:hypothetical protein
MTQPQRATGHREEVGAVRGAIVGHDSADLDVEAPIEGYGPLEIASGGDLLFVGQDFDVGQTRSVVDADVDVLPAGADCTETTVAVDTMSHPDDAPKLLDVEVQQIAWAATFIAPRWLLWLKQLQAMETGTLEHPCDGGARHLQSASDLGAGLATAPQLLHQLDPVRLQSPRTAMGAGRAVTQAVWPGFSMASQPLVDRAGTHSQGLSGGDNTPLLDLYSMDEKGSTTRGCSGETVDVHPGLLFGL